jgi:hypothetical protein
MNFREPNRITDGIYHEGKWERRERKGQIRVKVDRYGTVETFTSNIT